MTGRSSSTHRSALLMLCILVGLFVLASLGEVHAQTYDGYTLFNPTNSRTTYLVGMDKKTAHQWSNALGGGYSVYLLENGHLLRPAADPTAQLRGAASSGLIQEVDWNGAIVWEYKYSSATFIAHHDIEPMPNGNVLLIAWEVKTAAEASASGRATAGVMWPDHLVEIRPTGPKTGEIVWEWHAWDHLVQDRDPSKKNYGIVKDHPELIDINLGSTAIGPGGGDWLHINGVSYDPERDLIAISSHFMNEVYVIDHSTTTLEAAGHTGGRHGRGGDILYRWGSPKNYGAPGATAFDVVHCAWWIPKGHPGEGRLMAFDNNARTRASEVVELELPFDGNGKFIWTPGTAYGPQSAIWSYSAGSSFFSTHLGGNQRLPNGNTLITEATAGTIFEVSPSGTVVWELNFGREMARALRYGRTYPGLAGLLTSDVEDASPHSAELEVHNAPNPFSAGTVISYRVPVAGAVDLAIFDSMGRLVHHLRNEAQSPGVHQAAWNGTDSQGRRLGPGAYVCRVRCGQLVRSVILMLL